VLGSVRWQKSHCLPQLADRDISQDEVIACLLNGWFFERPYVENRAGDTQYRMTIQATVDGRRLRTPIALRPERNVLILSSIDLDQER